METAEHSHTHLGPVRDMFHMAAHHWDVPQEHQYGKEQGGDERPAEQYLDALRHESLGDALHHSREVGMTCRHPHAVDIAGAACKAVTNIVFHPSGMERSSHESSHEHMEDIEHGERLEEMLERHYFMQTPHEGYTQHGIAEPAPHQWQAELFAHEILRRHESHLWHHLALGELQLLV